MIFIIRNPFLCVKNKEIKAACSKLDREMTADIVFRSVACQLSLGDPYLTCFDTWAHYEMQYEEVISDISRTIDLERWVEFACSVHENAFETVWSKYPKEVADIPNREEVDGYMIGEYRHADGGSVSLTEDVYFIIKPEGGF